MKTSFIYCVLALILLGPFALVREGQAQTPEPPQGPMTGFTDRLAPPPTVYPPTQADQGAQVFYQVCMACHGDHGQGLTDEWRGVLDTSDQNCWQSRCHASNHPADGFVFPKVVPAVVGPQMSIRFTTGRGLYQFLKTEMPWQAPGSRSEAEYWQLTAFLLRLNGVDVGKEPLTPESAANIWLNPQAKPTPTVTPMSSNLPITPTSPARLWVIFIFGSVLLAGLSFFLVKYVIDHSSKR
jgi:cytochrome c5